MQDLTLTQLQAIQTLAKHPLTPFVDLWFSENGLDKIQIKSAIGAEFGEVEEVLDSILGEAFPNLKYHGQPAKFYNISDETDVELYHINCEGETLISLVMRSQPVQEEWTLDEIMRLEG